MISVGKLVIIGVAAIITSINVIADKPYKEITLQRDIQCLDHDTALVGLKNSGYSLIVSNISETDGKIDSIIQTWATPDGNWIVVEHNSEHKVTCILGVGEKTKIHISTSKTVWV